MKGNLSVRCQRCLRRLQWRKVDFTRPDSYHDWRLEVHCWCGIWDKAQELLVYQMARKAYDAALGVELETQRRKILDAALGRSGNLYFETLVNALPPHSREEGSGE